MGPGISDAVARRLRNTGLESQVQRTYGVPVTCVIQVLTVYESRKLDPRLHL